MRLLPYVAAGIYFGVVLVKSQAVSWFRMQEMFRFQSFHLYGVIGSAVVTGAISLFLLRRFGSFDIPRKTMGCRYLVGGLIFGVGWGLGGVCPGPMYALIGRGYIVVSVVLLSALIGTRVYAAWFADRVES